MAFASKRLRVQLPCGEATVVEHAPPTTPFVITNAFHTGNGCLHVFFTCEVTYCLQGTCGLTNNPTEFVACGGTIRCGGSMDPTIQQGGFQVDAEALPVLREALEAQLAEIDAAQKAVEEHTRGQA